MSDMKLVKNQTIVNGKIDHVGMFNDKHQTRVMLPSIDSFSMPAAAMITSEQRLGNVGDVIDNILCNLAGIPKSFDGRDGQKIQNANMWLVQVNA